MEVVTDKIHLATQELITNTWGGAVKILSYQNISSRASDVGRILLTQKEGVPRSIIVKHIPSSGFPAEHIERTHYEFAEELLAHRFMESCSGEKLFKPDLLAWDTRGLFFMKDLGEDYFEQQRTFNYLIPRLARSLACLHAYSRDHFGIYQEMRQEAGLGKLTDDHRRYGIVAHTQRFDLGKGYIMEQFKLGRSMQSARKVADELKQVEACIDDPASFLTLIHDDLGNARQTFEIEDQLYLLDFEYAKWSHALLDLCKPVLGKFELNTETGIYQWSCASFPKSFLYSYRQHLALDHNLEWEDEEWENAWHSALIYWGLCMVGRLMHLEPDRQLMGTIQQNINGILYQLRKVMIPDPKFPHFHQFIHDFLGLGEQEA